MESPVKTIEALTKEQEASVRIRRSTRLVVRLLVQICVPGPGGALEKVTGRSVVVNRYGCRIESKKFLPMGQVADITVFATGRTGKGKVIWADSRPNKNGNYEFALQFEGPCNLWGVEFPPEDWEKEQDNQDLISPTAPAQESPSEVSSRASLPVQTVQPMAPAGAPSAVREPAKPELGTAVVSAGLPSSIETAGSPPSPPAPSPTGEATIPVGPPAQSEASPSAIAEKACPTPTVEEAGMIHTTPADRLADAVRDLVRSAVSAEQATASEQLARTLEDRMERMRLEVLGQFAQQVQSVVSTQTSTLKQDANEIATQTQRVLSSSLQQWADAADQKAKTVQGEVASALEGALEGFRTQVTERLSQAEENFLEQCRCLAEQSLSAMVDNALRAMSLRIEEASKGLGALEDRTQKILSDTTSQLEQQSARSVDDTAKHLEAQLTEISQRIFSGFQAYSSAELEKKQQAIYAALQEQVQAVAQSSLQEVHGALARMFQGLSDKMQPVPTEAVAGSPR